MVQTEDVSSYWMAWREREVMVTERGSMRSHFVETWLWKMLWTCHMTNYRIMMMYRFWPWCVLEGWSAECNICLNVWTNIFLWHCWMVQWFNFFLEVTWWKSVWTLLWSGSSQIATICGCRERMWVLIQKIPLGSMLLHPLHSEMF